MQDFEERREAKRERYEEKARAVRQEADRLYAQAREMASVIPLGQPILVGHHSEGRDRRYRDRIHATYGKAFSAMDKADYYAKKAENYGTGGISSDDPKAVEKLREKLAGLEKLQESMRQANTVIRKHKGQPEKQRDALLALDFSESETRSLLTPNCYGGLGFMPFQLQNNNANIRRIRERIATLERASGRETREEETEGYTYREDAEENRLMFRFDGKPAEEIRDVLKTHGFKWSPSRGAWVRMWNGFGLHAASMVKNALSKFQEAK